jgi:hypothetical protein
MLFWYTALGGSFGGAVITRLGKDMLLKFDCPIVKQTPKKLAVAIVIVSVWPTM